MRRTGTQRSGSELFTLEAAAAYMRLPAAKVFRLVQTGELPADRIGRHWRFHRQALESWVRQAGEPPQERRREGDRLHD